MSISILNRGASGGLKPELTVAAPSGSTIDILQNGIVVSTYTLGADETEHTFVVKVGTYTVRGTRGDKVQSKEMVIDTVGQYSVTIDYKLWLYREGDLCEDVTGGWACEEVGYYDHAVSTVVGGSLNNDHILIDPNVNLKAEIAMGTRLKIDITQYKALYAELLRTAAPGADVRVLVDDRDIRNYALSTLFASQNNVKEILSADVSQITGEHYVVACSTSGTAKSNIYNVWLE
ncbi:MAG: hypothetical protein J6U65_03540 [Bacteroidaceae bacterium]|nr:hypothetical protein [Bacteroidaceae bacterium]